MNTHLVTEDQFELENVPAASSSSKLLSFVTAISAQYRNARNIEREAKRLYAMGDNALQGLGLTREEISEQLLKSYGE